MQESVDFRIGEKLDEPIHFLIDQRTQEEPQGLKVNAVLPTPSFFKVQDWQIESPPGKVLYQGPSTGYLSDLRFSPDGSRIAFLDHPNFSTDGYVALVDRSGHQKLLTPSYSGHAQGVAWSANGDEIWFTAAKRGIRNELRAVTLTGRERLISSQVAPLVLQDIARDGRVLFAAALELRSRIFYRGPGDVRERDLSGLDWSIIRDISADGKLVTFDESGEGAAESAAYIRDVNASVGVKLGPGRNPALSPDGKSVLAVAYDGGSVVIYPVGLGETKRIAFRTAKRLFSSPTNWDMGHESIA